MATIVQINERGQITIPKKMRNLFPGMDVLGIKADSGRIILEPLQTRDEFIEELEKRSKEAKKGKTYSLNEVDEILEQHYARQNKL